MGTMRISQLAERTGVPATTLRYYEDAGLLSADRTTAGYRVYGEDAVERLAFIGSAKQLGLPLEEIGELLAVWRTGPCAEVKADLRPRLTTRLADTRRRIRDLRSFAASLSAVLDHLDALPDRQGRCDATCEPPIPAEPPPSEPLRTDRWRTAPVACSLTGDGMTDRVTAWRELVEGADRTDLPDGIRLTVPADRAAGIAGLAATEQRCCPFFDFRLHLDGPVLHVEVRAPADGADLLAALFDPAE